MFTCSKHFFFVVKMITMHTHTHPFRFKFQSSPSQIPEFMVVVVVVEEKHSKNTHTHTFKTTTKQAFWCECFIRKKNTCRVVIWCIHHTHLIQPTKRSTIHTQCYLMMILMIPIINFIARFFFVLLSSTFTMTSLCILYSKTFVISWCHHHQCRDDKQGSRVSFFCCCYRQWMNEWKWFLFSVLFETHTHTHKHHAYLILELFQFLFWWWVMTISQFRIFLFPIYLFFF